MSTALSDNIAGHRAKYDHLARNLAADEVGRTYVGPGDPVLVGHSELETVRAHCSLAGAAVVDVGCGIGRLTQHLIGEPIASYLGLDIIPEILDEAIAKSAGDARFRFAIAADCRIPAPDASIDLVVGFSVITHLMDEEAFEYLEESSRVLRGGAVAIFSFLDLDLPSHQATFFDYVREHRHGHGDILKFTTKDVLTLFAMRAGFRSVSFVDGSADLQRSRIRSELIDVDTLPATYQFGQSLCVLNR
jgi:SAM-dependent methyltransferase